MPLDVLKSKLHILNMHDKGQAGKGLPTTLSNKMVQMSLMKDVSHSFTNLYFLD